MKMKDANQPEVKGACDNFFHGYLSDPSTPPHYFSLPPTHIVIPSSVTSARQILLLILAGILAYTILKAETF